MIDFSTLRGLTIPEGVVTRIEKGGAVLWEAQRGKYALLQVEKITSQTYAGETTYEDENFVLLDIYPKANGTVSVTYGGLTKTITDTSGAEEPNAQQVFFGTLYGVSDEVETPVSGALIIEGDCAAFANGTYTGNSKDSSYSCDCVTKILDFGTAERIPYGAFAPDLISAADSHYLVGKLVIPSTIKTIGDFAFQFCTSLTDVIIGEGVTSIGNCAFALLADESEALQRRVTMLSKNPPELVPATADDGTINYDNFTIAVSVGDTSTTTYPTIVVPKGCVEIYKSAEGWNTFADYIVEAL